MPKTDIVILKALLESNSEFVSGNTLANELGISRVGVWARLEKLREEEFSVEAIRHRGYRLLQEPPRINERLLRAYLEIYDCPVDTVYLKEVDSTNSEAERQLAAGRHAPFVVLSSQQLKGRGRMGRIWHSPDEGNLYASFAFRPNLPPVQMQTVTLWLGLRVCSFIEEEYGIQVRLKWPNDLLVEGKKVAGMLTEARVDADRTRDLVFGLGLNVNGEVKSWSPEIAKMATSLAEEKGQNFLINQVAAKLIVALLSAYNEFAEGTYKNQLESLWERYDCLKGRNVTVEYMGKPLKGTVAGLNADGALKLIPEGEKNAILLYSGEVTLGSARIA